MYIIPNGNNIRYAAVCKCLFNFIRLQMKWKIKLLINVEHEGTSLVQLTALNRCHNLWLLEFEMNLMKAVLSFQNLPVDMLAELTSPLLAFLCL